MAEIAEEVDLLQELSGSPEDNDHITILSSSSGKFLHKNVLPATSGLVTAIWNHPLRGNMWKFEKVAFHSKLSTKFFALADKRGQVYVFSILDNQYHVILPASHRVSALSFIESRKSDLVVAYSDGPVYLIDMDTKQIVGNLPVQRLKCGFAAPIRLIRSHPRKPIMMLLDSDNRVTLWDSR